MQKSYSSFLDHITAVLCGRPRYSEHPARHVESRYCDAHQVGLFADVADACVSGDASVESAAPSADTASSDDDDGGGDPDPDPDSDPLELSPSELTRQVAAFRTSRTGIPGVRFDIPSATFRASFVSNGKPQRIGAFATIDEAVTAIKRAYVGEVA